MKAFIFKDGVYVYVENFNESSIENESIASSIEIINDESYLFGGRVYISFYSSECWMDIDGISIKNISSDSEDFTTRLEYTQVAAYLTQMHTLGVDTFLANYKASLEKLKKELTEQADKLELDIERTKEVNNYMGYTKFNNVEYLNRRLNNIRNIIISIIAMLFNLSLNMNSGLDNHIYTEAYNYIINLCS